MPGAPRVHYSHYYAGILCASLDGGEKRDTKFALMTLLGVHLYVARWLAVTMRLAILPYNYYRSCMLCLVVTTLSFFSDTEVEKVTFLKYLYQCVTFITGGKHGISHSTVVLCITIEIAMVYQHYAHT